MRTVKKSVLIYLGTLFLLSIVFVLLSRSWNGIRYALGLVFFFVPGLSLSYAFFAERQLSRIERWLIAIALSLAVIPSASFILSKYHTPITTMSTAIVIGVVSLIGAVGIIIRHKFFSKKPT